MPILCMVSHRSKDQCFVDTQRSAALLSPSQKLVAAQPQEMTFDHSDKYGIIVLENAYGHLPIDVCMNKYLT